MKKILLMSMIATMGFDTVYATSCSHSFLEDAKNQMVSVVTANQTSNQIGMVQIEPKVAVNTCLAKQEDLGDAIIELDSYTKPKLEIPEVADLKDFFKKMPEFTRSCREADKIPVAEIDGLAEVDEASGSATVDVYKSGEIACSMLAPVVDSKVSFKVPDSLEDCVNNSDAIVISVDQKSINGFIITKKTAGSPEDFTASSQSEKPTLYASEKHVEMVNSLLSSIEEDPEGVDFKSAASEFKNYIENLDLSNSVPSDNTDLNSSEIPQKEQDEKILLALNQCRNISRGVAVAASNAFEGNFFALVDSAEDNASIDYNEFRVPDSIYQNVMLQIALRPNLKEILRKISEQDIAGEEIGIFCKLIRFDQLHPQEINSCGGSEYTSSETENTNRSALY
jgi:hypothetical protein